MSKQNRTTIRIQKETLKQLRIMKAKEEYDSYDKMIQSELLEGYDE
jgi:hypothetical protein